MKRLKYIIPALACMVGVAFATTNALRNTKDEDADRKVSLGESFYAGLQKVAQSTYPLRVQAGSSDGIPYGLRCDAVNDKHVSISWNTPEAVDGYFEDFEGHDDFAVNSPGTIGWSYIDGDNRNTYSWSACTFKNMGQKMAFIIMNPSATTPSVEANPNYVPTSGSKMLVCMPTNGAPNNDWIISPSLSFGEDFKISFKARSYRTDGLPAERMRVGYSLSDKTQSSFQFVTPAPYVELPAEWKLYEYTIPKEARYVCINCVSDDAFMMLIDDIMIGTNEIRPNVMDDPNGPRKIQGKHLTGFNVYRDGKKVNSKAVTEVRYTDVADTYATHRYTVTALYSDGSESAQSQALEVEVADPRLLPFEDDFDDWTMHTDKWSTPENPTGVESNWTIDYYTYGLVDPAATYGYSSLHDYDQSLVTRELRTQDRSTTYLRFDLRLQNWGVYPDEVATLSLEISSDNGKTWKTIDNYNNLQGEFNWTTHEYALNDYLNSDYFQLRWRAHGSYAMHIDYWYVDDVKVWNPEWGSLRLSVTGADGAVANTPVVLKGNNGSTKNVTTDAQGNISIGQLEEGDYAIIINKDGYNALNEQVSVRSGETASKTVRLTRPQMNISTTAIQPDMAVEDIRQEHFTISNTGDGPLTWRMNYAPAKQSGKPLDFEIRKTWEASGDLQTSIGFDGEYYYTTSWYYLGEFWKYDKEGNLIEQFRIPDMYYKLYDLAYDGRYFYGSDYSNRLFQLDFENKRIVNIIEITNAPELEITHVAYNPNNDRFYVGSWNTLCEVRRNGRASTMAAAFDENEYHSIYGSAYDNVTEGGPYLWLSAVESYNENMLDKIVIYQYNLNTKKFTGVKKAVTDLPGYKVGSAATGVNNICGLEGTCDLESGKFTLVGALQQSPCLFFEYNVAETDTWLDYTPRKATLQAGQSTDVQVTLNARNAEVGKTYSNAISINTIPDVGKQTITLGLKAIKASATPRPTNLAAQNGNNGNVTLTWSKPAATPQSYNVYRDGRQIAAGITATTYTDPGLVRGQYTYQVTAVYGAQESVRSDAVKHTVKVGAPYYAPVSLNSSVQLNQHVSLAWQSPLYNAGFSGQVMWGNGEHADQVGLSNGGTFYAGSVWNAQDMLPYRNKQITSASIRIVNPVSYLAVCIFRDGQRILRQQYDANIQYGEWTTVKLDNPVLIEPGCDYIVAFQMQHNAGLQPISIDGSETVDGKGNALSTDGEYWFPATQMAIDGNFSIKFDVQNSTVTETAPMGYNIYRDGVKVNAQPVMGTSYTEDLGQGGLYTYQVSSVYADGGESQLSQPTQVKIVDIAQRLAPTQLASDVQHNRQVSVFWGFPIQGSSSFPVNIQPSVTTNAAGYPSYVNSFVGVSGEIAVASDCHYIYTSVHSEDGRVNKYSIHGEYLGHFYIHGLDGIRNITYDGTDFWVSTAGTNIYKVDMEKGQILATYPISEYARHMTYVPTLDGGRGGFEVGDWNTSIYVNRMGAKVGDGPTLRGAAGTAYHDGRLYAFEQGGSNTHSITVYDCTTNRRIQEIDLEQYTGLNNISTAVAGGLSIVHTPEGLTLLAAAIQNTSSYTEFLFLDIAGVDGVAGYNVYRNGTRLNATPLTQRFYQETLTQEGTYDYQIETVYIDGKTSARSAAQTVTIVPAGTILPPTDVKAEPTTYGYDVAVSFADPDLSTSAALFQSFEGQAIDAPARVPEWDNVGNLWTSAARGYHGDAAITADEQTEATMVIPATGMGWMGFAARNADDHEGAATIQVLASESSDMGNFILVDEFTTSEMWHECSTYLPQGTRYVMIRKTQGQPQCYVDAVRLNPTKPQSNVWTYDVFRDGQMLGTTTGISFIDHNLTPGTYSYQVRAHSETGAISALSQSVTLNLDYSNGGQAPENLRVLEFADDHTTLQWNAPALGDAVNLKWHTGNSYDAAGLPSGGCFYAGVRWSPSDLSNFSHLALGQVEVYINQIPDALYLLVYQGNSLVRRQYVPTLKQYSYNTILLDKPLPIDPTRELRVVIYVEHNEITIPLGYDEGPANTGRGNLYSNDGVTYTTMDDENTGINGNWNITIGLKPYAGTARVQQRSTAVEDANAARGRQFAQHISVGEVPATTQPLRTQQAGTRVASTTNTFEGYNIYANNKRVNDQPVLSTDYVDHNSYLLYPYVQYKVSAVYSLLGEVFSNSVTINTTPVHTAQADGLHATYRQGQFVVTGTMQGQSISIYSAQGTLLHRTIAATGTTHCTVACAAGAYIVQVGDQAVKVTVR